MQKTLNSERLAKLRPLRFWGTPTVWLFISNSVFVGKGHNKLTAVKDALFNLKRRVSKEEYQARKEWLYDLLEAYELRSNML